MNSNKSDSGLLKQTHGDPTMMERLRSVEETSVEKFVPSEIIIKRGRQSTDNFKQKKTEIHDPP